MTATTLLSNAEVQLRAAQLESLHSAMVGRHFAALCVFAVLAALCSVAALVCCWLYVSGSGFAPFGYAPLGRAAGEKDAGASGSGGRRLGPRAQRALGALLLASAAALLLCAGYLLAVYWAESERISEVTGRYLELAEKYDQDMQEALRQRGGIHKREAGECPERYAILLGNYDPRYAGEALTPTHLVVIGPKKKRLPQDTPLVPYILGVLKRIRSPEFKEALRNLYCGTPLYAELKAHIE